jgi:hypothetical protein
MTGGPRHCWAELAGCVVDAGAPLERRRPAIDDKVGGLGERPKASRLAAPA